jgi:hypothetical protein
MSLENTLKKEINENAEHVEVLKRNEIEGSF